MKFLLAALFAATASAWKVDSPMGSKLMAAATLKEGHRGLNDQERDVSWVANMSIKFHSCHSLLQVNGEEGGGGEEGRLYTQHLVQFQLCPTASCTYGHKSCSGGAQYIVDMGTFVQLYVQMKQEALEQACEVVRENCYCDNANDDQACENQCFIDNDLEDCIEWDNENGDQQEDEDIERYMECEAVENQNGNNNNNNNWNYNGDGQYYGEVFVGPKCSDNGKSIHLGAFYDEACSVPADNGVYESVSYGRELPYSSESIVLPDCISCERVDENNNNNNNNNNQNQNNNNNNNNNNNQNQAELVELCEQTYELAGRCESNLGIQYPDETGCDFINSVLPRMEGASKSIRASGSSNRTAVVCAWIFGIMTAVLGVYAFLLYRRLKRSKVALNDQEDSPQV